MLCIPGVTVTCAQHRQPWHSAAAASAASSSPARTRLVGCPAVQRPRGPEIQVGFLRIDGPSQHAGRCQCGRHLQEGRRRRVGEERQEQSAYSGLHLCPARRLAGTTAAAGTTGLQSSADQQPQQAQHASASSLTMPSKSAAAVSWVQMKAGRRPPPAGCSWGRPQKLWSMSAIHK